MREEREEAYVLQGGEGEGRKRRDREGERMETVREERVDTVTEEREEHMYCMEKTMREETVRE